MPTAKSPRFTGERRKCRLTGCPATFDVPIAAKNKEFCSATHRSQFHAEQHRQAMALLRETQVKETPAS